MPFSQYLMITYNMIGDYDTQYKMIIEKYPVSNIHVILIQKTPITNKNYHN